MMLAPGAAKSLSRRAGDDINGASLHRLTHMMQDSASTTRRVTKATKEAWKEASMKKKLRLVTTRRRASPRPLAKKTDLLSLRIIMRCSRKHHRNEGVTWTMIRVTGVF